MINMELVRFINRETGLPYSQDIDGNYLTSENGAKISTRGGIPRFVDDDNYSSNFGLQWNLFSDTQIDNDQLHLSSTRFFAQTLWKQADLDKKLVLEVGCGAGRFTCILLRETNAYVHSIDYSGAVDANKKNNSEFIQSGRFALAQSDIYELPFPKCSFDKTFCFGVLQHTPDFKASIFALVDHTKVGGEIVVDFYPVKGFWTKIHAKYILRPLTKRLPHAYLLKLIEANVDWLMALHDFLVSIRLHWLTRFLPLCNISETLPTGTDPLLRRQWAVLDTFDQYSPRYDNPQRINSVAKMFEEAGANVTFAGFVNFDGGKSAVVRAVKR